MMAFAYMLQCADGSYYVGSTRTSLEARVGEHNAGHHGGYTASRRPVKLVWSQEFMQITDAVAAERQIKGWNRAKKEALIEHDFDEIARLAKRRSAVTSEKSE
jgi:putative endonuclease